MKGATIQVMKVIGTAKYRSKVSLPETYPFQP